MEAVGNVAPGGDLFMKIIRGGRADVHHHWPVASRWRDKLAGALPAKSLPAVVNEWRERNAPKVLRQVARLAPAQAIAKRAGLMTAHGELWLTLIRDGEVYPLGLAGLRVVTTAGVGYIVDAHQNSVELENMRYHGYGTGTTAEASGDTALVTELTTQYASDSTRPTGSLTENAANIFETVATLSPDSGGTLAITEHGIFSATSAGVLLDRTVFSAVNLVASSDSLQTTYRLTYTAGS